MITLSYQGYAVHDDTVQRYLEQWWNDLDHTCKAGNICGDYKGYGSALLFAGVNIPEGSIIRQARITVTSCPQNYYLPGSRIYIYGEDARAPGPTTSYEDHVGRARTEANIYWTELPAWYPGEKYSTPDFSRIVQEIVDKHAGTGDSITIFIEDPWFADQDGRWKEYASVRHLTYEPAFLEIVYDAPGAPVQHTLDISAGQGGTTDPSPGAYPYDEGTLVSVTAIPDSGYQFVEWQEGGVTISTSNQLAITMDADHYITAIFEEIVIPPTQHLLELSVSGNGSTEPAPGNHLYDEGTIVTITAIPDPGHDFIEWQSDGVTFSTVNPLIITMVADLSLVAVFQEIIIPPTKYTLVIESGPGGTTLPAAGSYLVDEGIIILVSASPSSGYRFVGWTLDGEDMGLNLLINIPMDRDHYLIAAFELIPVHTLNIAVIGNGTTDPVPGSYSFEEGTLISLSAAPGAGYRFQEWQEDGIFFSSNSHIDVLLDSDRNFIAVFEAIPEYTLSITVDGNGTTSPAPGNYSYLEGAVAMVTAIPDTGHQFMEWQTGGVMISQNNPIAITMDSDHAITAVFQEIVVPPEEHAVTISIIGSGESEPASGTYTFQEGNLLTILATPATGWKFDHWEGDVSGIAPEITVEILTDMTIIAIFSEIEVPPSRKGWILPAAAAAAGVLTAAIVLGGKRPKI